MMLNVGLLFLRAIFTAALFFLNYRPVLNSGPEEAIELRFMVWSVHHNATGRQSASQFSKEVKWWATLESNQACVSARELQSPATPCGLSPTDGLITCGSMVRQPQKWHENHRSVPGHTSDNLT